MKTVLSSSLNQGSPPLPHLSIIIFVHMCVQEPAETRRSIAPLELKLQLFMSHSLDARNRN